MLRKLLANHVSRDFILSGIILFSLYIITHNPIVRPTPQVRPGNWSIQLMQHPLLFGFAGHNYLALRDGEGTIISELHGLATDPRTHAWKYIGSRPTDLLQVWEFERGKYLGGGIFPGIVLYQGQEDSIEALWEKGLACKDPINEKEIPYPPYGVRIRNETINSNSVAYTLAKCMGLDARHIGIWTPGSAVNLLAQ